MEDYHMHHIDNLRERVEALEHHAQRIERRVRWWRGIACTAVMLGLSSWALPSSTAQTAEEEYSRRGLARRLAALEYKLVHVRGGTDEVVITGANLRLVNGLGATATTNGLGNLIVGYNEPRLPVPELDFLPSDNRTGSHNIVVGEFHNFTSFGGLVVGQLNEISGEFASVGGGLANTASGRSASVSGGLGNTASGEVAAVSGGLANTASGEFASVSGGSTNIASNNLTWVSGGIGNTASGTNGASVSGGRFNTASGDGSSVSGGNSNTASGSFSSVSGGSNRSAPGEFNWAAGPLFADF
jgi:hypothetical protein